MCGGRDFFYWDELKSRRKIFYRLDNDFNIDDDDTHKLVVTKEQN